MEQWFASLSREERLEIINLGKQAKDGTSIQNLRSSVDKLTQHHQELLDRISCLNTRSDDPIERFESNESSVQYITHLLHTKVCGGLIVGTPSGNIIPIVLNNIPGCVVCHKSYVLQQHVNDYISSIEARMSGSQPPQFAIFVVPEDVNIPGSFSTFHGQLIHGASGTTCTALYVSGVQQYPSRLCSLLMSVTLLWQLQGTSEPSERCHSKQIAYLIETLRESIDTAKKAVRRQSEIQNFANGIVDGSHQIVSDLNRRIHMAEIFLKRNHLHTGSIRDLKISPVSVHHQIETMRMKLRAAWQDLQQKGESLSRANTIRAVMKKFPGEIQGFKNPNCLANTLRYYNTTFSKEKEDYLSQDSKYA